ncbi:hypothetical protein ACIBG4_36165 [Nonomuraea sp. NPDC050383]|uniref:hypothetical protein n=1 Tax=Nonomuraea sp. NPDC050383 TaxID=3364362 RepID=UPI003791E08C
MREELRSLPGDLAELVGRHLVAAERALEEDDPDRAHEHTKVARRFAARIGVVREAAGIVAYHAGHYSEALSDLRAARRMTGSDAYLPVMADCERGLGRPERALDLVRSPEAERLDRPERIELAMVESGARRDLGQNDAAVITLQRLPELRDPEPKPWSARLAFAYADALLDAGHQDAAIDWFARAMAFDGEGETDAAERYATLTGAVIDDLEEDYEDDDDLDVPLDDDAAFGATSSQDAEQSEQPQHSDQSGHSEADAENDLGEEDSDEEDSEEDSDEEGSDEEDADGEASDGDDLGEDVRVEDGGSVGQQASSESAVTADAQDVSAEDVSKHDVADDEGAEEDVSGGDATHDAPTKDAPAKGASAAAVTEPETGTAASTAGEPSDSPAADPVAEDVQQAGDSPAAAEDVKSDPGEAAGSKRSAKAKPGADSAPDINLAFIEPNFGDILDQPDEPSEDRPKRDS